jgi:hypothetical protein
MVGHGTSGAKPFVVAKARHSGQSWRGGSACLAWLGFPKVWRACIANRAVLREFAGPVARLAAAYARFGCSACAADRFGVVSRQTCQVPARRADTSLEHSRIASRAVAISADVTMNFGHCVAAIIADAFALCNHRSVERNLRWRYAHAICTERLDRGFVMAIRVAFACRPPLWARLGKGRCVLGTALSQPLIAVLERPVSRATCIS